MGTSRGLPSLTLIAFTTEYAGFSSFSMERIAAAFLCSSEPIWPLSLMPLGTKCRTHIIHVLYMPASLYSSSTMAILSVSSFAERIKSAIPSITTRCIPP